MVSSNLSETISRLNDEKRTSNGLMAKMTAQTQKIEELQAEKGYCRDSEGFVRCS